MNKILNRGREKKPHSRYARLLYVTLLSLTRSLSLDAVLSQRKHIQAFCIKMELRAPRLSCGFSWRAKRFPQHSFLWKLWLSP